MFKIGLDIGYGHTKIATEDGKRIIFPSLAKKGKKLDLDNMLGAAEDYIVQINNDTWYVGKMAQKENTFATRAFEQTDRYNDDAFKAMLATALAVATKDTEQDILLVTGLPLSLYENSQKEFQNFLKSFSAFIEFDGIDREVKVKEAIVFPQAGGIFFSPSCLEARRELPDNSDVTVIDIGYRTTDCAVFSHDKGSFQFQIEKSFTIDVGMSTVFKALSRIIAKEIGVIDVSLEDAETVFRKGVCYKKNEAIDLREEIETLKDSICSNINENFKRNITQTAKVNTVLLAGGGSIALKDNLLKLLPHSKPVADTQMANALGFLNIANRFDLL